MKKSHDTKQRKMVCLDDLYNVMAYSKKTGKSRSSIYRWAKLGKVELVDANGQLLVLEPVEEPTEENTN